MFILKLAGYLFSSLCSHCSIRLRVLLAEEEVSHSRRCNIDCIHVVCASELDLVFLFPAFMKQPDICHRAGGNEEWKKGMRIVISSHFKELPAIQAA